MCISSIWNGFRKAWKHQVLHTKLENLHWQGWAGIICEYLLFEMALGSHEKHKVLHTKLENLHWQGWAGIIYVNILYLKWLWEGMKTPSFAHNLHWQGWARIIYVHIFYLKWLWEGMKAPSFAHEIGESALAGVGRNNICEYLLFEMALGRHEKTKFCTWNWRICTGRGGQE